MILFIDTAQKNCTVGLYDIDNLDSVTWEWKKDTGGEVLEAIKKILFKNKVELSEIDAIAVNRGPGSYTGVRVGVTVANTLGWTLNIPVFGYSLEDIGKVAKKIAQNINQGNYSPSHFPTPIYKN